MENASQKTLSNLFCCLFLASIKLSGVPNKAVQEKEWCMEVAWVHLSNSSEMKTSTLREQASFQEQETGRQDEC